MRKRESPVTSLDIWEIDYGDMILNEQEQWVASPYINDLLAAGWEPYGVTNMFKPNDDGGYNYTERHWFRRKKQDA